mgnify:CR=1 FL=1
MKDIEGEEERRVVLEARMHCQACRVKVFKAIIGYPGTQEIMLLFSRNAFEISVNLLQLESQCACRHIDIEYVHTLSMYVHTYTFAPMPQKIHTYADLLMHACT